MKNKGKFEKGLLILLTVSLHPLIAINALTLLCWHMTSSYMFLK